jgi:hypothetical protein
MRKQSCIIFAAIFVFGLSIVTSNAQELNRDTLKVEIKEELREEMEAETAFGTALTLSGRSEAPPAERVASGGPPEGGLYRNGYFTGSD